MNRRSLLAHAVDGALMIPALAVAATARPSRHRDDTEADRIIVDPANQGPARQIRSSISTGMRVERVMTR
jgi:hypothetical protein